MRNREQLAEPPINLALDKSAIEFIEQDRSGWGISAVLAGTA